MMLIHTNLLLYAYNPRVPEHQASKRWLEAALSRSTLVRFAWLSLWAFLRISTSPRVFEHPLTMTAAETVVPAWLAQAVAGILDPGERHGDLFCGLIRDGQTMGPLVTDAALAAIPLGAHLLYPASG